jgi:transcriptional regulator with XRE-family HTH domain
MSWMLNYDTTYMALGHSPKLPSNTWTQLAESKEFRDEFSALQLKRGVAFQVRALLKQRGWTQAELAERANLTQGVVSRAQNPDYGNLTINTINRIAAGFDVAFLGRFVPFGELVDWFENLSEDSVQVESFDREFRAVKKPKARKSVRRHRRGAKVAFLGRPSMTGAFPTALQGNLFEINQRTPTDDFIKRIAGGLTDGDSTGATANAAA